MTDEAIVRDLEAQDIGQDVEQEEQEQSENGALSYKRYSITSYGADYTVDQLVARIQRGDIYIPDFQRAYVWKIQQASQLIESLLLGLPVPSIFISKDDKQKLLVIDGQQRLFSLLYFFEGIFKPNDPDQMEFKLTGVQQPFAGKTYQTLNDEDRRQLNDSVIRAVVLQQNAPREDFATSIYFIFRRLNTNSVPLTQQEIRAAIFRGSLNDLLKELDDYPKWGQIFNSKTGKLRKRGQELILRFFAFYEGYEQYAEPISLEEFLNNYMSKFAEADQQKITQLRQLFTHTIDAVHESVGKQTFRFKGGRFNAAFFDAVMVGIAKRLERSKPAKSKLERAYKILSSNSDFQNAAIVSTADVNQVQKRMRLAIEAFDAV